VIQHPTDSIALAEITRLPCVARPLRIRVARNLEKRVLKAGYTKSIYNSPQDAKFARTLVPESDRERIVALPIGVDTTIFHPAPEKLTNGCVRVIFSGSMNYRPNIDAALALVRDVLPKITSNVEIRLVGRNPAAELLQLAVNNPRVAVTGAVSDIAAELRAGDIFVAPMVSGGGISNKVLEAMASGLPVITTPLVADNFPDRPASMWVASKSEDIAAAIDTLAGNADLRSRRAREAAEYIRTGSWSWQSRADRLIELLRQNTRN
jgi:glycosyltransferase involved in cell wall biosynthesis